MLAWFTRLRLLAALLLVAVGCGGPTFIVQQYDGPPRPRESIAIVRVNGSDAAQITTLDGEGTNVGIAEDSRLHLEVLPGSHTVWVRNAAAPEEPPQRIQFLAEPGRVYRPVLTVAPNAGSNKALGAIARMYEVDPSSDALLRDVTALPPQQAPTKTAPVSPPAPSPSPQAPVAPPGDPSIPPGDPSTPPGAPGTTPVTPMPAPAPPPVQPSLAPPPARLPSENPPSSTTPLGPDSGTTSPAPPTPGRP